MGVGGKGKYHVRCPICHGSCSISHSEINQDTFRLQVPAPLYVISCHVISAKASECPLKINQPTAKFLLFWVILIEAVLNSCRSECPSLGELVVGFCSDGFELKWRIAVGVTISFLLTCITTRGPSISHLRVPEKVHEYQVCCYGDQWCIQLLSSSNLSWHPTKTNDRLRRFLRERKELQVLFPGCNRF